MLDHAYMSFTGGRIGVPVVDVDSSKAPSTCIVTSYNSAGKERCRDRDDDQTTYRVLCSDGPHDEILVKDAYFTPHGIPWHGVFMDGGMSDNNPGQLALRERYKAMPESRRPDQFVSIGTGASLHGAPLLWGQGVYDMQHTLSLTLPDQPDDIDHWFRRFDLPLDAELPDSADAQAIDRLADATWERFLSDPAIHDLARAVLASSFYFELRSLPFFKDGRYSCHGRILCRIPVTKPAFESLMRKLNSMSAQFLIQQKACQGKGRRGSRSTGQGISANLIASAAKASMSVSIYNISASPLVIKSLIQPQKLQWVGLKPPALDVTYCTGVKVMANLMIY
ncbi:hypothetical protein K469DRAFT_692526 [Zopfia rhizophila CBS 207.26]|uniref:FabD/lysophospholipase-like protein n=1 Tax=Zopfia rhizophila CBS 207.26 TaxID=1314779 RepID=A0A6A6DNE1_9PEZI|nr:hypothetical protein K469DRAFT_692526 [Zopfia rhizophila CBS 207.26]